MKLVGSNFIHSYKSQTIIEMQELNNWQAIGQLYQYSIDNFDLTMPEERIYNQIIRKSFGYGNTSCTLPLKDIKLSKPAAIKALKSLEYQGYISRIKAKQLGPKTAYEYKINFLEGMPYIKTKKSKKDKQIEFDKLFNEWDMQLTADKKQKIGNLVERIKYYKENIYDV